MRKGPEQEADGGKKVAFGTHFQAATACPVLQDPCASCPDPREVRCVCGVQSRADPGPRSEHGKGQHWEKGVQGW